MSGDWYRNKQWNRKIEKTFFERLGRARSQRDQYLAIQAVTLADIRPEVTLKLADLYFETKKHHFDDTRVIDAKAEAYLTLGNIPKAISTYRESISWVESREKTGFTTVAWSQLPFLIAKHRVTQEYEYALSLLNSQRRDPLFPSAGFTRHAAYALILKDLGEVELASGHAQRALEYAEMKDSGLQYHQKLGLVGTGFKDIRATLAKLARK